MLRIKILRLIPEPAVHFQLLKNPGAKTENSVAIFPALKQINIPDSKLMGCNIEPIFGSALISTCLTWRKRSSYLQCQMNCQLWARNAFIMCRGDPRQDSDSRGCSAVPAARQVSMTRAAVQPDCCRCCLLLELRWWWCVCTCVKVHELCVRVCVCVCVCTKM